LLGAGVLLARPRTGLAEALTSDRVGGILARRMLPAVTILPVIVGLLRLRAQQAGWFGTEFGVTLIVLSNVIILSAVVWSNALWLNRIDTAREFGEQRNRALAAIVSSSSDAIYSNDLNGNVSSWNVGAQLLHGYTAEEIVGRPVNSIVPDHLDEEDAQFLQQIALGQSVVREDTLRKHKDGRMVRVSLVISPIRDVLGRVTGTSTIAHDITERKQTEEAIRQSEERFSKAFRCSPLPITISTLTGGLIIDCNDAFQRMIGFSLEEVVGRTARELNIWPFPEQRKAMTDELAILGSVNSHEAEIRTKLGEVRSVQFSCEFISLNDTACMLATIVDVTERKNLEQQFRQSQKMEAVGRLAGGIAHDFNNLLGVIIGFGELAQGALTPGTPARNYIDKIQKAAQRATLLTRQLLAFSRQQVLQPLVLNLNAVIIDFGDMLKRVIGESFVLNHVLSSSLGNARVDRGQLEQILMNLVVNARDAMVGSGTIVIETENVDLDEVCANQHHPPVEPGRYVMLSVSDTGCGMDGATLSKIFEPFFTTKPVGQGTGLGLSTVYGVVQQSGGCIWVFSEPGRGTSFKMYFPRIDNAVETVALQQPNLEMAGGAETVLVVEDDQSLRELTIILLKKAGYTTLEAKDGHDALTLAQQYKEPIHLLVTDVIMPGMNGGELASKLKNLRPNLTVLFVSGYTANLISDQKLLTSSEFLLQKPFSQRSLLDAMRNALSVSPLAPA
jgi:two-component system, cell cycle sensor histidine kinase and response regulator CckA